MSKLKLPAKCIFCERPGVTKQHLWPDRLKKIVPTMQTHNTTIVRNDKTLPDRSIVSGKPTPRPYRQGSNLTRQVRRVCRRCNGGWIRELEEAAIAIATPLIIGDRTTLTQSDQAIIARWIAVMVAVSEYVDADSVAIPTQTRKALMAASVLSDDWTICLAPLDGPRWRTSLRRHSMMLHTRLVPFGSEGGPLNIRHPVKNTQVTTIGIGRLIAQGATSSNRDVIAFYRSRISALKAAQVHPYIGNIQWPPGPPLDDTDADTLADWLNRWLESPQRLGTPSRSFKPARN